MTGSAGSDGSAGTENLAGLRDSAGANNLASSNSSPDSKNSPNEQEPQLTEHSPTVKSTYRRGRPPGPDTTPTILAPAAGLPTWYQPLINRLGSVGPEELAGFGVPLGEQAKSSAVLVLLGEDDTANPDVLLTQRHAGLRSHAGQVSFPGGSVDDTDTGPIHTAMREAQEEMLIDPTQVEPVALLPELWIPPSGFAVTTVLGWWKQPSAVTIGSPAEVAAAQRIRVSDLANPDNRVWVTHPIGFTGPGFVVNNMFIWGFTAIVLDKLMTLGEWDTEWQTHAETLPHDYKLTN